MKTNLKIIAIILVGLASIQAPAFFDTNALQKQIQNKAKSIVASGKLKTVNDNRNFNENSCTDFSGDWVGTCEGVSPNPNSRIKIKQSGCAFMETMPEEGKIQNFDLSGVGLDNENSSSVFASVSFSKAFKWNSDKTVIEGELTALLNSAFLPGGPNQGHVTVLLMKDGQDLLAFTKVEGSVFEKIGETSCRYKKNK